MAGEVVSLDVTSYFSDPDGDALAFSASSSSTGVATTQLSGSLLTKLERFHWKPIIDSVELCAPADEEFQ